MTLATDFPDYDPATLSAMPSDWTYDGWRNDACPSFMAGPRLRVFIDYADPSQRDCGPEIPRYSVQDMGADFSSSLLDSDDWQAVLDFVLATRKADAAKRYLDAIGYDPFTDEPSRDVAEVEETLREHAEEAAAAKS